MIAPDELFFEERLQYIVGGREPSGRALRRSVLKRSSGSYANDVRAGNRVSAVITRLNGSRQLPEFHHGTFSSSSLISRLYASYASVSLPL